MTKETFSLISIFTRPFMAALCGFGMYNWYIYFNWDLIPSLMFSLYISAIIMYVLK